MRLPEPYRSILKWIKRFLLCVCFIVGVLISSYIVYFFIITMSDTYKCMYLGDDYAVITDDSNNPGIYRITLKGIHDCGHSQRYIIASGANQDPKYWIIDKETDSISDPLSEEDFFRMYDT